MDVAPSSAVFSQQDFSFGLITALFLVFLTSALALALQVALLGTEALFLSLSVDVERRFMEWVGGK
jgi:hypothetical protein